MGTIPTEIYRIQTGIELQLHLFSARLTSVLPIVTFNTFPLFSVASPRNTHSKNLLVTTRLSLFSFLRGKIKRKVKKCIFNLYTKYHIFRTITRTPVFYHKKKQKLTDYPHCRITRTPIHSFLPHILSN